MLETIASAGASAGASVAAPAGGQDRAVAHPVRLHGQLHHRFRLSLVGERAERQFELIHNESRVVREAVTRIDRILNENASKRSRYAKLERMADDLAAAIAPHSGCTKGCSACCNISVSMSSIEAERIGRKTGLKPSSPGASDPLALQQRYFRSPCPFLVDSHCSIYEDRPLSCRLHYTLDRDAYFCDTDIDPENSAVPNVDMQAFWLAYGVLTHELGAELGDIREFFPRGD